MKTWHVVVSLIAFVAVLAFGTWMVQETARQGVRQEVARKFEPYIAITYGHSQEGLDVILDTVFKKLEAAQKPDECTTCPECTTCLSSQEGDNAHLSFGWTWSSSP